MEESGWILETDRLHIREIDKSLAQRIMDSVFDDEEFDAYHDALPAAVIQDAMEDVDSVMAFITSLTSVLESNDRKQFGAWNQADELVACACVVDWSTATPILEVSVLKEYQRQGIASEFLAALTSWMSGNRNIDHFVYRLRIENLPSEKTILRLGGQLQKPKSKIEELNVKTYWLFPGKKKDSARS